MKIKALLAISSLLGAPLAAYAQPVTGFYVDLGLGTNIVQKTTYNVPAEPGNSGKFFFNPDYAGVFGGGYGFGNGLRVQLDGNFYRNSAHKFTSNRGFSAGMWGGVNRYGFMANVFYDLPVKFVVQPYVGAGIGYQWEKFLHVRDAGGDNLGGTGGSFSYDLIAGAAYDVPVVPGLAVTAEYRFSQLVQTHGAYHDVTPFLSNNKVDVGQEASHTLLLGLRYQLFNAPAAVAPAPAPMPVAAPAPAPAKTYLVFFDWDKAVLTPRATQIIAEAAADSKTQNVTTLNVSGYTDTSGTVVYNQGLSERRAKAVAAKLVDDGVPAAEIEIHAYGETHLLVPTGPNVREPQNRRVEIVLN